MVCYFTKLVKRLHSSTGITCVFRRLTSIKVQFGNFGKLKVHWKIGPIMMRSLAKRVQLNWIGIILGSFQDGKLTFQLMRMLDTTTVQSEYLWQFSVQSLDSFRKTLELRWGGDKHCLWNRVYPWPEWGLEAFFKAHRLAPDQCSLMAFCVSCGYGSLFQ